MEDIYEPWHFYLKTIREGLSSGKIKVELSPGRELSDLDIAISYVTDISYQAGYKYITAEMAYYLVKAFTDVTVDDVSKECDPNEI